MKFSTVAQVNATMKHMRENKEGKLVQVPVKMKKAIIDLEIEYRDKVERGLKKGEVDSDFVHGGKFSLNKFVKLCGIGGKTYDPKTGRNRSWGTQGSAYNRWKDHYEDMVSEVSFPDNCYSLSRQGAGNNFKHGLSKGLGELAQQSGALARKVKEVALTNDAKAMGYKLVKVA